MDRFINKHAPVDVFVPAVAGSIVRVFQLDEAGAFRLSRRGCVFHSIMIAASGSFGSVLVKTGTGRTIWCQPSTFTGSFVVDGYAEEGLIVEAWMENRPFVTISWREPDMELV